MTSEQLEVARAERMRQNGHAALTIEDARTWIEETGLCLFLPKRQLSSSLAPSFVEAVIGQRNPTPDPKQIALAEELLVRLELDGVAVRLNLLGQAGEQPDYVVAAWVLPYVYALRGDRDWRRTPQLTGSRQVSPLAIQAYKRLESSDSTIAELKQFLGHGVTEAAVLRAITELWQQLRIIPVVAAPGHAAKWQLLRHRFQKAIAEGASTSQVTAISVLASIFLQAVIAATMEEVELFLAPLTARSKIREVLRGLVATRQVHTLSLGHAPHFYVAGTLPEFSVATTLYASTTLSGSSYLGHLEDREESYPEPAVAVAEPPVSVPEVHHHHAFENHSNGNHGNGSHANGSGTHKPAASKPHFSRSSSSHSAHARDRKPSQASTSNRPARRPAESRSNGHATSSSRPAAAKSRWSSGSPAKSSHTASSHTSRNGHGASATTSKTGHSNGHAKSASAASGKPAWGKTKSSRPAAAGKSSSSNRSASLSRSAASPRKESRGSAVAGRGNRKPALAGAGSGAKRNGFNSKQGTKKRG